MCFSPKLVFSFSLNLVSKMYHEHEREPTINPNQDSWFESSDTRITARRLHYYCVGVGSPTTEVCVAFHTIWSECPSGRLMVRKCLEMVRRWCAPRIGRSMLYNWATYPQNFECNYVDQVLQWHIYIYMYTHTLTSSLLPSHVIPSSNCASWLLLCKPREGCLKEEYKNKKDLNTKQRQWKLVSWVCRENKQNTNQRQARNVPNAGMLVPAKNTKPKTNPHRKSK